MKHSPQLAADCRRFFKRAIGEFTMLKSRPIIAFVATTTPSRAKAFYSKTLGLKLVSQDDFALVFDAGGTMLRVAIVQELQPAGYTVLGWIIPDIRRAVLDLGKRRVKFERYSFLDQDDLGIWTSPSGARVAWFKDPDGNTLSLTQFERPRRTPRHNKPRVRERPKGAPERSTLRNR
jgi:catechol 2,3-dioxygenase-like lactoylglutathione lyase family enzyme